MRRSSMSLLSKLSLVLFLLCWLVPAGLAGATGARAQTATAAAAKKTTHRANAGTPTIEVGPTTVNAGESIAITGTGFIASEPIELQLVATTNGVNTAYTIANVTTTAAGGFIAPKVHINSYTQSGTYHVLALSLDPKSTDKAEATLVIQAAKPTLTVRPQSFSPNDTIAVSGTHFGKSETVSFSLSTASGSASVPIGSTKTTTAGAFTRVALHVPFGVAPGNLLLVAVGATSNLQVSVPVTVGGAVAAITLSGSSALPGDKLSVTGTHFQPGESVSVDLVTLSSSIHLGSAVANSAGRFVLTDVLIPANTPQGTVSVVATGSTSKLSATAQIKIGAKAANLTPTTTTLTAGDTLGLKGDGFIPGETVSIVLSGTKISPLTLVTLIVGTDGTFSIDKLTIPLSVPAGTYTLTASGQTSGRATMATLTVQAPPPSAPILSVIGATAAPGQVYLVSPGGFVQLAGSSFSHNARITLTLVGNNATIGLATVTTNSAGSFGPIGFTIPAIAPAGVYTLEAVVGGSNVATIKLQVIVRTPHISASTGVLVANHAVRVNGAGFAPNEQVVLSLNSAAIPTAPSTVITNASGAFTATFIVPQTITNGTNTLSASGVASRATAALALQARLGVASRWYFANGDTTGNHRTVITMLNPTAGAAHVTMTFLYQAGATTQYSQVIQAHSVATVDLALAAGYGRRISTILEADQKISAVSTITYGNADSASTPGASGPSRLWYLAEGYDNGSFTDEVVIMNPGTTTATIDVRFLPFNNHPVQETRFVMQPRSNISIDASQYIPRQSFSTIVTSDQNVVVERAMRFGANGRGADDKIGSNSAATVWNFAYAESAGDRQTFFTVLNPNQASPAAVTATFFDQTGKPVGTQTIVVDALHRGNIKLNDVLAGAKVATVLTSNVPVVVERPVYQSSPDLNSAAAGDVSFGRNSGGLSWAFPSLSTAGTDSSNLYFFNPGVKTVTALVTFYTATGNTATQPVTIPANGDVVLNVNSVPNIPAGALGAVVKSTNGHSFVAEEIVLNPTTQRFDSIEGIAQ